MFDYTYDQEAIIRALGIESSDDEFKAHVLQRVDELLRTRTRMIILDELSDEDTLALEKIGNNRQAAIELLTRAFPNWKQLYDEELQGIVEELKGMMS